MIEEPTEASVVVSEEPAPAAAEPVASEVPAEVPAGWMPHAFAAFTGAFPNDFKGTVASLEIKVELPWQDGKWLESDVEAEVASLDRLIDDSIREMPEFVAWQVAANRLAEYREAITSIRSRIDAAKASAAELIASGAVSAEELLATIGGDPADVAKLAALEEACPAVQAKTEELLRALHIAAKQGAMTLVHSARDAAAERRTALAKELCGLAGPIFDEMLKADEMHRALARGAFSESRVERFLFVVAGKMPTLPPPSIAPAPGKPGANTGFPNVNWEWVSGGQR